MKKFIGNPTFKKKWRALALLFTIFLAPIILPLMFLGGCIAIWRYSKRKPNTKKRNIAIAIAIIGMLGSYAIDKLDLNYLANETGQNQVAHFASNSNNHISRSATSSSERDTVEKEKEKEKEQKEKTEKEKKEKEQKEKAEKEKKEKEQKEKAEKEKKEKEQKEKAEKEKKEKEQKEAEEKEKKEKEQKEAEEKEKKEKEQKEAEEAKKTNEAEQAVQVLEGNQVTENVAPAQTAVEQVTDPTAKANFVHRIELVQNAINVRAQQAAEASQQAQQQTQQQAQNQAISGSGYYKDINGRWHRPNGQFASKKEIANAGLAW